MRPSTSNSSAAGEVLGAGRAGVGAESVGSLPIGASSKAVTSGGREGAATVGHLQEFTSAAKVLLDLVICL